MSETTSEEVPKNESVTENQESKQKSPLPEFVEINNTFDELTIDPIIKHIADTNELKVTWETLQQILSDLISKQYEIIEEKLVDEKTKEAVDNLLLRINHTIKDHLNCPFTIQRLCELVIEPKKYYRVYLKYLRAVEKVLLVTSYWEDYQTDETANMIIDDSSVTDGRLFNTTKTFELEPHNFDIDEPEKDDSVSSLDEDKEKDTSSANEEKELTEDLNNVVESETESSIETEIETEGDNEKTLTESEDKNNKADSKMDLD